MNKLYKYLLIVVLLVQVTTASADDFDANQTKCISNFNSLNLLGAFFAATNLKSDKDDIRFRIDGDNQIVHNVTDGKVILIERDTNGLGNVVMIRDKNGICAIYGNLKSFGQEIELDNEIQANDTIGIVDQFVFLIVIKQSRTMKGEEYLQQLNTKLFD